MLRKSTLLAVAASAVLGLAMLAPSSASAHGGGGMHGGGIHVGGGTHGHPCHGCGIHPHPHPHWHVRYHRPIWYGVRPVYTTYATPVAGPCTCLSKEYTQEGAVLFKDRCTNEAAMNPPAVVPQQTGAIEPQQ